MAQLPFRRRLVQTAKARLSLRARQLASGWAAGTHRADRKGSGVEFAGHRAYTPGDDLRHLDRHALLRHRRHLIREFLTDTERSVHLVIDATSSMRYVDQGRERAETESKLGRAVLLGGALAFIARSAGDLIGLTIVSESGEVTRKPRTSAESFDTILHELEHLDQMSTRLDTDKEKLISSDKTLDWNQVFHRLGAALPRGALIFVLSDFLDLDPEASRSLAALCTQRRTVRAVQVLSEDEVQFPFEGPLRFRDPETGQEVETDGAEVRAAYQQALSELTARLKGELLAQGGGLYRAVTSSDPLDALRIIVSGEIGERR